MRFRYWSLDQIWAKLLDSYRSLNGSGLASFEKPVRCMTASSRRPNRSGTRETGHQKVMQSTAMPVAATRISCRDQDHRCALQSLLSGQLPRAGRYELRLRG